MLVQRCWERGSLGHLIGLDYNKVDIVLNRTNHQISAESFLGLMLFGDTAADQLNENSKK